jgi:hypothetical protein
LFGSLFSLGLLQSLAFDVLELDLKRAYLILLDVNFKAQFPALLLKPVDL